MIFLVVLAILSCPISTLGQSFTQFVYQLPPPPGLYGPLSRNYALYNTEKLHYGRIVGPTSFAFLNGSVYTVTGDRKVVDIATCIPKVIVNLSTPGCNSNPTCGYLTSIRVGLDGQLLVLDAYRGLFHVNPTTGAVRQLYSSINPVNGRVPRYLNDLVQTPDGIIFMSDSSDRYDVANDIYIIMDGAPRGRILALNPANGAITEVVRDVLVYPNGLELTADGTALLIAETGRARILRMSLLAATYKQISIFAPNLPGLPGNIRRSARGTFWVGLSLIRHSGIPNSMDMFSNNPGARSRTVATVDQNTIKSYFPRYGMVVELDSNGRIIGSLHDPTGQAFTSVSEAAENEGLLYVASHGTYFTGRIVLPQGDGRVVTIDSVIQVMRSRCQIPEDKLEQARAVLNSYIERQTGGFPANGTRTTSRPQFTIAPFTQPGFPGVTTTPRPAGATTQSFNALFA